jgi:hypothetical protein
LRPRGAILRAAAGLLRPPRDQALIDLAHDARDFLLGRPRPEPEEPLSILLRGARASATRGNFDVALAEADRLTQAAIGVRRDVARRRGARGAIARAMGEAQRTGGRIDLSATEREWLERALETDPRWLPWIPAAVEPPAPAGDVVLDLAWISVPYVQDEHTARIHLVALAQRDAGMQPLVTTRPGFPRSIGVENAPGVDVVDGVAYHRLELGAGYETAAPPGQYLSDYAWLAATIARREHPRVLHVFGADQGYRVGLVGLALRAWLGVPLVYDVGSPLHYEPPATGGPAALDAESPRDEDESYDERERLVAAETRCLVEADAVVSPTEAIRDEVIRRGVAQTKVVVIANPADAEGTGADGQRPENGQRFRRLYESLLSRSPAPSTAAAGLAAASRR